MPRGDKTAYTDKQKRKAAHIAASYEERGMPESEAKARAWATVNAAGVTLKPLPPAATPTGPPPRRRAGPRGAQDQPSRRLPNRSA